jgi:hypothetical protein
MILVVDKKATDFVISPDGSGIPRHCEELGRSNLVDTAYIGNNVPNISRSLCSSIKKSFCW